MNAGFRAVLFLALAVIVLAAALWVGGCFSNP
jgi:hypothetical protein